MSKARGLADLGNVYNDGALSNRNLIINGSHIVNQRGIVSVTTPSDQPVFTSDGWRSYALGQSSNITIQEATLPDGTVVNTHKTTTTTTGQWMHPFQKVETFGKSYLRGKLVTISLWVKTNVAGQLIRICDTNTCVEIGDEIPSDGAWHYVTASYTLPSNMATGVSSFMQVHPAFGGGAITVEGSYVEFTLVQLEVGPATPFEHRSYGDELTSCRRYARLIGDGLTGNGVTASTWGASYVADPPMRASPTAYLTQTSIRISDHFYSDYNSSGSAMAFSNLSADGGRIGINGFSGMTTARWMSAWGNTNGTFVLLDAEL